MVPLVAVILGAATISVGITAAMYQRHWTMPKPPLKPTRQLDLFAAFHSHAGPKEKQVMEHTDIKHALLWFRGWPNAQLSIGLASQKRGSTSTTKPKQMLRFCTK